MITLTKDSGPAEMAGIQKLELGASWDTTGGGHSGLLGRLSRKIGTDLDLIAVLMNGQDPVRFAGIDQLNPLGDHSVVHSGDNQTGRGDGDDETLTLELDRISPNVTAIVFVAVAFKHGSSLDRAANVSFKVYDSTGGTKQQVADIWPSLLTKDNACAVAKAERVDGVWQLTVLNVTGKVTQGDRQSLMRFAIGK
jgi:tellurium resistance protein TerZ